MSRKRLTQRFPFLLPLRRTQRKLCFYAAMRLDGRRYAQITGGGPLPYRLFSASCPLYNGNTGFDMAYQQNKVFNLKLAAGPLNGLLIAPGETFSFWRLVRHADRQIAYKEGLTIQDGKLVTTQGGGLCQMSNLLFWLFLHTPLTVTQRCGHAVKEFPEPNSDEIKGVDATVSEGWKDLRVYNGAGRTYQITLSFDGGSITGAILTDEEPPLRYRVTNGAITYHRRNGRIYESAPVERTEYHWATGAAVGQKLLYTNTCEICYPLGDTPISEVKSTWAS